MDKQAIQAIRTLTYSTAIAKSKVGRIRALLPEIELAQQAGVHLTDIASALNELGFEWMNLKCLQNLLYQARKNKKYPPTKIPNRETQPIHDKRQVVLGGIGSGISADSILDEARKSMQSKLPASSITLDLLRSPSVKSTIERKETK